MSASDVCITGSNDASSKLVSKILLAKQVCRADWCCLEMLKVVASAVYGDFKVADCWVMQTDGHVVFDIETPDWCCWNIPEVVAWAVQGDFRSWSCHIVQLVVDVDTDAATTEGMGPRSGGWSPFLLDTSNFRVNIIFWMEDLLIAVSHFYDFICTVANRCQVISTGMKKTKTKY